jgi:hypothetical protein
MDTPSSTAFKAIVVVSLRGLEMIPPPILSEAVQQ